MPISGMILCEKTKQFNEQLHAQEATAPSFTASSGWLWHFCNRHGIRGLRLQGEKLSVDTELLNLSRKSYRMFHPSML